MKAMKKDLAGVSPVIAVILMVAITVVLAGVVFLWAQSFTDDSGGTVETLNLRSEVEIVAGTPNTYYVSFEVLGGSVTWGDYEVRINNVALAVAPTTTAGGATAATTSNAGDIAYYALVGPYSLGDNVNVKLINIGENKVVWENTIRVTNA